MNNENNGGKKKRERMVEIIATGHATSSPFFRELSFDFRDTMGLFHEAFFFWIFEYRGARSFSSIISFFFFLIDER